MKRCMAILLTVVMTLTLSACGGGKTDTGGAAEPAPAADAASEASGAEKEDPTPTPIPTPTPTPACLVFDYETADLEVGYPWSFPEPVESESVLIFTDPEGEWTLSFTPLGYREVENEISNMDNKMASISEFGYYKDVSAEDADFCGQKARLYKFSRNPDHDPVTEGYTTWLQEPHAFYLVNYGEALIGGYGGFMVDVAAPENTLADLEAILADLDVTTILSNVSFGEPETSKVESLPGITAAFPIRWLTGSNETNTLYGSGTTAEGANVSVYFTTSIYADPQEAAFHVAEGYRTFEEGGRTWYGEVRTSTLSENEINTLELYTDFSENHCLCAKLTVFDSDAAGVWAFAEGEAFRKLLSDLVLEPDLFHEPEDDRKDEAGFTCNNVNEIDGYTGEGGALVVPALVGTNEILGIGTNVFKENETITSVELESGISYVDYGAFRGCANLETVVLPETVTYIGAHAFEDCTSLKTISLGGVVTIEAEAFQGCSALGDVTLPMAAMIGSSAFYQAGSGEGSFSCPADGTLYGAGALAGSKFAAIEIGPNANLDERNIFQGAEAESVTVGEGCKAIGDYCFGANGFEDHTLKSVSLPDTVTHIGEYAFSGRSDVSEVNISGASELGTGAFSYTGLRSVTVPGTVSEIPDNCFESCPYLDSITLEEGVSSVGAFAFYYAGQHYDGDQYYICLTDEEALDYPELVLSGGEPFDYAVTINLPSTLKTVGQGAFGASIILGVYLPWLTEADQMPAFDQGAFSGSWVHQFFFSQETIEAIGMELDLILMQLDSLGDIAWYEDGMKCYFSSEEIIFEG